jgi:hypothetical protein
VTRKATSSVFLSVFLAAALLAGCTTDDRVPDSTPGQAPAMVTSGYCVTIEDSVRVPIRVLLVIDTSSSMEVNDPDRNRVLAAADLLAARGGCQDVAFGLVAFNSAASRVTDGFAQDPATTADRLNELNTMEGSNYIDALAMAETVIHEDLALVRAEIEAAEEAGDSTRFTRPFYHVVFLSDGIPRMPDGLLQSEDQIILRPRSWWTSRARLQDSPFTLLSSA